MANIIFYFSGTGNSFVVARDIAAILGDTKVISIADAVKETCIALPYERVGIVFPAYYGSPPLLIKRFMSKLTFHNDLYVFNVVTSGGVAGRSFSSVSEYAKMQKGQLNAGFHVLMPGNNITSYSAYPLFLQRLLNNRAKKRTAKIAKAVTKKRKTRIRRGNLLLWTEKATPLEQIGLNYRFARGFRTTEKCTQCKVCTKICPLNNITMTNSKPVFGDNCECCMACIQWCPVQAIEHLYSTQSRKRYRHPEIKASDLFPNSNKF